MSRANQTPTRKNERTIGSVTGLDRRFKKPKYNSARDSRANLYPQDMGAIMGRYYQAVYGGKKKR